MIHLYSDTRGELSGSHHTPSGGRNWTGTLLLASVREVDPEVCIGLLLAVSTERLSIQCKGTGWTLCECRFEFCSISTFLHLESNFRCGYKISESEPLTALPIAKKGETNSLKSSPVEPDRSPLCKLSAERH